MKLVSESFLLLYAILRVAETFSKRPKLPGKIVYRCSLPLIVSAYVVFYLSILADVFSNDAPISPIHVITGVALVLVSLIGRNWSIKTHGVFHSIYIEIRDRHILVKAGPYGFVRNPYYLSNLIEAFGLALIPNSRWPLGILCLVYLPLLIHRLITEEKAHRAKFQSSFEDYRMRVPALIPNCVWDWTARSPTRKVTGQSIS